MKRKTLQQNLSRNGSIWAQQSHTVRSYPPQIQRKEDTKDRSRKAKESDLSTSLEGRMLQKLTYTYIKACMYEDVRCGQVYNSSEERRGENSNTHQYGKGWQAYVSYVPWCAVRVHSSRHGMSWFTEIQGIHDGADRCPGHDRCWWRVLLFCNHGSEEFHRGFYQLVSSVCFYFYFWGHYLLITVKLMIRTWFWRDPWNSLLLVQVIQKARCLYG